jgi:hypothetical protein
MLCHVFGKSSIASEFSQSGRVNHAKMAMTLRSRASSRCSPVESRRPVRIQLPFAGFSATFAETPHPARRWSRIVIHGRTERKAGDMSRTQDRVLTVASVAGMLTSSVAAMTIWLLLRQPLTVANAMDSRNLAPLVEAVARAFVNALAIVVRYL